MYILSILKLSGNFVQINFVILFSVHMNECVDDE